MPVVLFDLPGHGNSGGTAGYTFEVADAIQLVANGLGPIDSIVSHSFGSGSAAVIQTEGLQVDRTVFISTPFGRGDRWVRVALEHGYTEDDAHRARARYMARFSEFRATYDWWAEVPRLDTDLLFVHSTADERAPIKDVRDVVATCPRAALVEVDGLDHRGVARDPRALDQVVAHLRARS